jgi:hypothetical protein
VRVSVNKATEGRQTPWDSSSLTDEFRFFPGQGAAAPEQPAAKRTVDEWRSELQGKPAEVAHEMIVAAGTDEAYEAFVALFTQPPFGQEAREWLDRHHRMVAWNNAVIANTSSAYRGFLAQYPDSDLAATARKLEERLRNRPNITAGVAAVVAPVTNAALAAPTCPCGGVPPVPLKKVDLAPKKRLEPEPPPRKRVEHEPPPKRASSHPPHRGRHDDDDNDVVYRRPPPPDYYEPAPGPSIGLGIGMGGFGGGGGGYGGGGMGGRGR